MLDRLHPGVAGRYDLRGLLLREGTSVFPSVKKAQEGNEEMHFEEV